MLSLQSGQTEQAIGHFRDSLRLNPDSAPTHYNLGIALSLERKFDEAAAEFREALRVDPDYADAHNNLGAVLTLSGRLDEAAEHYRRAVALRPTTPTHTATWRESSRPRGTVPRPWTNSIARRPSNPTCRRRSPVSHGSVRRRVTRRCAIQTRPSGSASARLN